MAQSALITVMSNAARKAAKGLLRDFGEVDKLQISRKGPSNFVTSSDLKAEKVLREELKKARPDFGFLLEEGGEISGKDKSMRWIVDPLDGTSNFIHAVPYFCISIGLEKRVGGKSTLVAGVIYDPIHNEMFTAEEHKGAFMNDYRMVVAQRSSFEQAMIVTGNPRFTDIEDRRIVRMIEHVGKGGASIRYSGSAALDLAYVAAGRCDACWFVRMKPWDVAAGMLMVKEAGGTMTTLDGAQATIDSPTLLAASPSIHTSMVRAIQKAA